MRAPFAGVRARFDSTSLASTPRTLRVARPLQIPGAMPVDRTRHDRSPIALRPRRTIAESTRTRRPEVVADTRPVWRQRGAFVERGGAEAPRTEGTRAPRAHRGIGAGGDPRAASGAPQPSRTGGGGASVGIGGRQHAPRPAAPLPNDEGFHTDASGRPTFYGTDDDSNYLVEQTDDGVKITNLDTNDVFEIGHDELQGHLAISLRDGDDHVIVDESVTISLAIGGGDGDDVIDASLAQGAIFAQGGDGDDTIYGGANDDTLDGGAGDDEIRGGEGTDWVSGNTGNDSLLGQGGDDVVTGGEGHDVVMGGEGADRLYGGDGSDAIYADADDTRIDAGLVQGRRGTPPGGDEFEDLIVAEQGAVAVDGLDAGDVVAHHDPAATQAWLDAHPEFEIDQSDPDFAARVFADLGVMLATPHSADLLDELAQALDDANEHIVFIPRDRPGASWGWADDESLDDTYELESSLRTVPYETQVELLGDVVAVRPESNRFPLPATFHELVHAYQWLIGPDAEGTTVFEDGTDVENDELQATGLDWLDANLDVQPGGVGADRNGTPYSDNAFREALGLRLRQRYGGAQGDMSEAQTLGWRLLDALMRGMAQ